LLEGPTSWKLDIFLLAEMLILVVVGLVHIPSARPMRNGHAESLHGRLRTLATPMCRSSWGLMNLDGARSIAKNHDIGRDWMMKAAQQHNPRAAWKLHKRP
jgi:hypothetical protein